ncbi:PREDICTED: potassium/sodium hyperpolarization-activated cyclic nucleotide-gated channel 1-like [Dinoponera quadriceps]|uniref:Potassium/sodium hyperpolarization-activated cyclic nucleotide-gated channel 1-like n=1 Tax=Dinoponera quadriceps TaxID=609295 RepID=A0A6P3X603_DINQU|nr:PREDICTED: potassium/sodium hyperpolarization-activated cyclic nucleotide-gated channel 1-like [Dinoponera quadriceps]
MQHSPRVEHVCKMPKEEDPLTTLIPGTSVWSRLRRWFLRTRIVSRRHPFTRWCVKSNKAFRYDISRHIESYPYMIHPFSSFRIMWETAMTVFIIAALIVTPILFTFFVNHEKWHINHAINAVLVCDIVLWFLTGYYDHQTQSIILDSRIVASKYLRGFFVLNVLPVLPLEFLATAREPIWFLKSVNLLKIVWMRNLLIYSRRLYYVYRINFHLYKIAEMGVIMVIYVHWVACLEYYIPLIVAKVAGPDDESWIRSAYMLKRETRFQIYLACLHRALIALAASAHYLNMQTTEDIVYNLILTILGFFAFIYLLARFLQLMTTFHSTNKRHLKLIQQLQQYMRHKELPYFLQRRLLAYYNYRNQKGLERDKQIMRYVSPYLREKLLLHNYMSLLKNVELFRHLPQTIVTQLADALHSEIFITNDVLIKAGTRGDALYIVASGTVAVFNNVGKEICHLEDGAYFGEIALVMEDEWRIASVVAVENCEVHVLSRVNFQRVLAPYPDLLTHLQNVALAFLEQLLSLEEAGELDFSTLASVKINISSIKTRRRD